MPAFTRIIGIDYSGAQTPTASLKGLRVYLTEGGGPPVEVPSPPSPCTGPARALPKEGVRLIELAQNARRLFEKQDSREKRRLLNFLVSNCSWADGELSVTLKQPFDLIAETATIDAQKKAAEEVSNGPSANWLPGPDSNESSNLLKIYNLCSEDRFSTHK